MHEVSKIGVHINAVADFDRMLAFFRKAKPRVALIIEHAAAYDFVVAAKEVSPLTRWFARKYVADQPLDYPIQRAREHGQRIMDSRLSQVIATWTGYNEIAGYPYVPNPGSEQVLAYFAFERELADFLHHYEKFYAGGKWSVGNPDYQWWGHPQMLQTVVKYDVLVLHEYCAPVMFEPRSFDPPAPDPEVYIESGHYCLRYREVMQRLGSRCPPILIGECGIDSLAANTWHVDTPDPSKHYGWKQFVDVATYMGQLAWYERQLRKDQNVLGCCVYLLGVEDTTWASFDILGAMSDRVAVYNEASHQSSQLTKVTVEELIGEHAQLHIIPYNLDAAFDVYRKRVGGTPTGWEARSREVDYVINEYLTIRYQVYVEGHIQHIVCARIDLDKNPLTFEGVPTMWEVAIWHFNHAN